MINFIEKAMAILTENKIGYIYRSRIGYELAIKNEFLKDREVQERLQDLFGKQSILTEKQEKETVWIIKVGKKPGVNVICESNLYLVCLQLLKKVQEAK